MVYNDAVWQRIKDLNQNIRKLSVFKPFEDRHCGLQRGYIQSKEMSYGSLDLRKVICKNLTQ